MCICEVQLLVPAPCPESCGMWCCWNVTQGSVGLQWDVVLLECRTGLCRDAVEKALGISGFLSHSVPFPTVLVHHINKSLCSLGFRMRKLLLFCISTCSLSLLSDLHPISWCALGVLQVILYKGALPEDG